MLENRFAGGQRNDLDCPIAPGRIAAEFESVHARLQGGQTVIGDWAGAPAPHNNATAAIAKAGYRILIDLMIKRTHAIDFPRKRQ